MTDKQKLIDWIYHCSDMATLEEIVYTYIQVHSRDFSAIRIDDFIASLGVLLSDKIGDLENGCRIARERATYLKCYLEGKMYANEEAARECVGLQIENAKAILEGTERVVL